MKQPWPESEQEDDEAIAQYWASREGLAAALARRAVHLHKLIKLNAPELVIEGARQLIFKSLMTFPVDEEARIAHIKMKQNIENEEMAALEKAGYFAELEGRQAP